MDSIPKQNDRLISIKNSGYGVQNKKQNNEKFE